MASDAEDMEQRETSGIPQDVQEDFKKFMEEWVDGGKGWIKRHKILPAYLLYIEETSTMDEPYQRIIHRTYFCAPPPGKSFEESRGNLRAGKACFIERPEEGKNTLGFIAKYGENRWQQYEVIAFMPQQSTEFRMPLGDSEEIIIVYDPRGIFQKIDLFHLERTLEPELQLTTKEGTLCAHFDEEPDVVKLEINRGAQFRKEVLRIPRIIDKEKIIETLAPQERFADPFNADPYDDRSWLEADLKRVVGIESEPPKNFRR